MTTSLKPAILPTTSQVPTIARRTVSAVKVSFQSNTRQGMATENLYANYEHPTGELHDYRYIGDNKDERYNLKHRT